MNIIDSYCTETSRVSSTSFVYVRYKHIVVFTIDGMLDIKTSHQIDTPTTFLQCVADSCSNIHRIKRELHTMLIQFGLKPKYSINDDLYTNREIAFNTISPKVVPCACPLGLSCSSSRKSILEMAFYTYSIRRKA